MVDVSQIELKDNINDEWCFLDKLSCLKVSNNKTVDKQCNVK